MKADGGTTSPAVVRDHSDPGDETLRNFHYQHAYGVILLVGAAIGKLPYVSIWCEHHEDFLAERNDGKYDAYQIKTATPEDGPWVWARDPLRDSIKRFVRLHRKFPGQIPAFGFVSNVEHLDSRAVRDIKRSPARLLESLAGPMPNELREAFGDLREHCECEDGELRYVLERLRFQKGPGRDSFADEIAHTHLPALDTCRTMNVAQLNRCLDGLVQVVLRASALQVRDPARHWCAVVGEDRNDPYLRAKRIAVNVVRDLLAEMATCPFTFVPSSGRVNLGTGDGKMSVLEQKLVRGGLSEYVDIVRHRSVSAERHLIELAHLKPDEIDGIVNQIGSVVEGECGEARAEASLQGEPYGRRMWVDVNRRLRQLASERPEMVHRQQYEVLAGMAGLLTEACRVWWSERFELEDVT